MKKLILPITFAIAFLVLPATPAHAQTQGCNEDTNIPCQDPAPMPEPGSFALVGIGLLALSGFVLLGRKKLGQDNNR